MTAETTHLSPSDGNQRTPCCDQTPFDLPRAGRMTQDARHVTCGKPLLTPETTAALLRECIAVVKSGETLVIRAPDWWNPQNIDEYQRFLDGVTEWRDLGVKLLVLPGEEFAVIAQEPPGSVVPD